MISEEELIIILDECCYLNKKTLKKRDESSLSYLIDKSMTQSQCIKLGILVEKILRQIILKLTNFKDIKPKNIKGKKEMDHLFVDEENKIIYYAELKANINLDTEKSKSTYKKILEIYKELKNEFSNYEIRWCLLAFRYLNNNEIPKVLKSKYNEIKDNLYGINDYINLLKINNLFTKEEYILFLNIIANKLINNS